MKISFWKHHPISDQKGQLLAQEAIEFQNKFNFDFVKLTPAGNWLAVCYGAKDEVWENDSVGRRKITDFPLKTTKDFYTLQLFSFKEEILVEILNAMQISANQVTVPVYATIFCPISQLIQISGLELFLKTVKEDPEAINSALKVIVENTLKVIEKSFQMGVKGLYFVTQHMQEELVSFEIYNQFGKPSDETCLQKATEIFDEVIFHIHGDNCYACITEHLPRLSLHCSYDSNKKENNLIFEKTGYPVIYGLPASKLLEANSIEECKVILSKYPVNKMLTCECVLPLDFPDEKIDLWKKYTLSN
jgi:uroporphyrinogen decarboxylase